MKRASRLYGWGGWKMPVLRPSDPENCEDGCPICTRARRNVAWARVIQKKELAITFGGCWWGRARQRKYGMTPDQALPDA